MSDSTKNNWVLLLLFAVSCQPQDKAQGRVSASQRPIEQTKQVEDTIKIVNNYVFEVLKYKDPFLRRKYFKTKFETTPSEYEPSVTDTILTLYNQGNEFTYYTGGDKSIAGTAALLSFNITSDTILLPNNIHNNMTRNEVANKFGIQRFKGVLRLSEEEGYQKLFFTFKNDSLVRIQFESDYLD